ncbi:RNA polymerase sigma factor [Qipengyuania sp. YG27]|uniref:RNA polymerase sigma factor n=1 Tax=Qipengyuania mesophila TaxID=2867246 RepID=A0ABS7JX32_9SPHN|nr:RNA polymerase sigma factor [Qipengyuania mesophila]MBX7502161.1 RNA polymerase sigma factor [Qipengyuania mesophila]
MEGALSEAEDSGLRKLAAEMRPQLVRFIVSRGCEPDEAEDVYQDLFVKLAGWRGGPVANARAYLFQMTNNLVRDLRRGARRQQGRDDGWARSQYGQDLMSDPQPTPEHTALDRDFLAKVERALAAMPPRTVEILRLYRVDGVGQKAIASRLDISLSAVEKHLQRAYRELQLVRATLEGETRAAHMEDSHV